MKKTTGRFLSKVAQGLPHRLCKISAHSVERFGTYRKKTRGGGGCINPLPVRGLIRIYLKTVLNDFSTSADCRSKM